MSSLPPPPSSPTVYSAPSQLSREISHHPYKTAYAPFTPSNSEQRLLPTYYRGCWHVVSRSCFCRYRHNLPCRKSFTPRRASSLTRRRCIRVSSIVQDSPLLPPVGVWPVFQCQCGRVPSQAGYRSSPGNQRSPIKKSQSHAGLEIRSRRKRSRPDHMSVHFLRTAHIPGQTCL